MSKPVFLLLHGAWHTPACFDLIVPLLEESGYEVVRPALPSSGANPPEPNFDKNVKTIRHAVENIRDHGKNVIVVTHSYSGIPAGTALEGLEATVSRNGVVRLIYVMSFMVPDGFQHSPSGTRDGMVEAMLTDIGAKAPMYQDVSDEEIASLVDALQPQSLDVYWSKTTSAAWRVIPTTYAICEKDMPSTVTAVHWLVYSAKANGPRRIDRIVSRDVGHSPFLSQPRWTADMLIHEASVPTDEKNDGQICLAAPCIGFMHSY